jgi:MFS transporter, OFA family, oxalate/formate antiporter
MSYRHIDQFSDPEYNLMDRDLLNNKKRHSPARYALIIISSIFITVCTGAVYGWSIFVAPLRDNFNYTTADTQLIYGAMLISFTVVMLFVYKVLRKYGPRITASIGAVLFCSGYLVASISDGKLSIMVLSMGIFTGSGMAFGFVAVLNNLVKWFPNHKGLATGLAVCGYGAGAILISQVAGFLLSENWYILDIFRFSGIMYGFLFLGFAQFLTTPSWYQYVPAEAHIDIKQLLKDKRFWILFYVLFAGSFAGLLFNGNLEPIGVSNGTDVRAAGMAITLFAIGNTAGRLIWGTFHDIFGGKMVVITALSILTVFTLLLLIFASSSIAFMITSFILGIAYASNFVAYAADCSDIWGIARLDITYPAISIAYGLSGLAGPVVGGVIRDSAGSYSAALIIGAAVCATGIAVYAGFMPQTGKIRKKAEASIQVGIEANVQGYE